MINSYIAGLWLQGKRIERREPDGSWFALPLVSESTVCYPFSDGNQYRVAATPGEILYKADPESRKYPAWEELDADDAAHWEQYAKNLEMYGFRGQR